MVVTTHQPSPHAAAPPAPVAAWDSEVVVLRGESRADLRDRVLSLATAVEQQPSALAEIAASLVAELQPGGSRLAIVASSTEDLAKKLRRAGDRLADPKCKQIRDTNGLYYFSQPLFPQGSLALLFPGEGAQYTNMLLDLCGVLPEVEDTFVWCDRIGAESGRPSLRGVLHPPAGREAEAEAELRRLGPSIFGVLVADLALLKIVRNLAVHAQAMAGDSEGELAELFAAGSMGSEETAGQRLDATMDILNRQEDEAGGPDVALLAVGAGKLVVDEIAASVAGGSVIVAMDNCPHQCVAVGPTPSIAAVESVLLERGLVCERLPFRRPYHTPMFEPWMGPLRQLFVGVPFQQSHTPVYSCSTAAKFPTEPAAIRELTVNHWVTPVEFARMIETMYADGVRIFVEAGPRGNLSAFAEDVLRGKPMAAIPANLPRKSGPTQINHMVGSWSRTMPLNLAHLHTSRTPQRDQRSEVRDQTNREHDSVLSSTLSSDLCEAPVCQDAPSTRTSRRWSSFSTSNAK